jgi:carbamoyl-phosphate synthase large subunit
MMLRILTEASGSLVCGYLIKAIREAGHSPVASDINMNCVGRYLADDFVLMPHKEASNLWDEVSQLLRDNRIDLVIPSLDETLIGWAENKYRFAKQGTSVAISSSETIRTFVDKWLAYLFFVEHDIPTPLTSLSQDFPLIKPRKGRGGAGVRITEERVEMEGMIAQEVISGTEYTVDVLCDLNSAPIYIVPRRRLAVKEGKSTQGIVDAHPDVIAEATRLCKAASFIGPINIQCFVDERIGIKIIEVNPRIAGGMALGFAATENWIALMGEWLNSAQPITPKPIKNGLKMARYYAEVFIPSD